MKSKRTTRMQQAEILKKQLTEALRKSDKFIRVKPSAFQVRFTSAQTKYDYNVYFGPHEIVIYLVNDNRVVGKYDYDEFRLFYILKYL